MAARGGGAGLGRVGMLLATALAPATWGTTYLVTTEMLPADRPLLVAGVRALPAGLLLVALSRRLPSGVWWWRSLVLGMLNVGLFFPLIFAGAYRLPGGVASTIGAVSPLLVVGLSFLIGGVRPQARVLLAGVGGVVGVGLLVLGSQARIDPIGVGLMLVATALMATGVVMSARWGRPEGVSLLATTGWQLTVGGTVIVPLMFAVEGMPPVPTGRNLLGFGYLVLIATALAYVLWFRGIERLGADAASFLGLVNPLVATFAGLLILSQTPAPLQVLGLVIALGAMLLGRGPARARKLADAVEPVRVVNEPNRSTVAKVS
ncbi:EamA family transporter [Streptomyces sp. SID3343]|uniref:EamA family transporter n=1 Tax=Streptomyces sp. SID3343 TaxID=2690260 RepID=UPI0013BFA73D|nr:EamA family transporter [Streptomyces sp. SID3343]MYW06146.1 EamA family transporter [Streptomyces sp. SID3343]